MRLTCGLMYRTMRAAWALALVVACSRGAPRPAPDPVPAAPAAAAPAAAAPAAAGAGRVVKQRMHSAALGVDKDVMVYLPGGYDDAPARRWPVLYYLHGLGGNETNWLSGGKLDRAADALGLAAIVVMPDGDDGFYTDSVTAGGYDACIANGSGLFIPDQPREQTCVRNRAYETYVIRDLIGWTDATYRTIADRAGRGIAGLSMGGFGALKLAMRHPELFAAAASHSGVNALLYGGPRPYQPGKVKLVDDPAQWGRTVPAIGVWVRGIFGPDIASWRAHDPAALLDELAPGELALYLDCGTEDEFLLHDGAAYVHDLLTAKGIAHDYYRGPGRHDFAFWSARVSNSLEFLRRHVAAAR